MSGLEKCGAATLGAPGSLASTQQLGTIAEAERSVLAPLQLDLRIVC